MAEGLKQKLNEDLKTSMKAGAALKISVLRMAMTAVHNREIQLLKKTEGLSDEEIIEVLRTEVKKRNDSASEFQKGGRMDLAEKENAEAVILAEYLPAEISDEDLMRILKDGIREEGATGEKDFGKVMKAVMPVLKGKASGGRISSALKKLLGS
ncbi:GatB/YqeY domain-containing protein [Candidatus Giovannonibacteria bacterium]|nr:GatB/YqeY domain-containing protein [Candidatus Giovannonibacteria bacterium]